MTNNNALFTKKITCPACERMYEGTGFLSSRIRRKKSYSDFYVEYEGLNPNYYLVQVCPTCGYAFYKNPVPLSQKQKALIHEKISRQWLARNFNGERSNATATEVYKLAYLCGQLTRQPENLQAGILLHIAWLYREGHDKENELRFLKLAKDKYQAIYEGDASGIDVGRTLYILGELCRKLDDYSGAVNWFRRIIDDKRIVDATIIRMAREQYAETRVEMKELKQPAFM